MAESWRTAWVTGASSGIGRATCLELARGGTRVAASARNAEALGHLASESGGDVTPAPLDVTDAEAVARAVATIERDVGEIDLAVLAAGIWKQGAAREWRVEDFARSMDVNYMGVVNALAALVPRMRERGQGRIAIVASVAGYVGLPRAAAYGPTKAALINLAEGLAQELDGSGVSVGVVSPGFVDTPMTKENRFPMPFLMTPEAAAERLVRGLEAGRFEVVFPRRLAYALKFARLLPYPLFFPLMRNTVGRRR